jgi:hypothetical protein
VSRFGRQSKLAEVGAAGQERIARSEVDLGLEGLAGDVAVRYLAGAGVGRLRVRDERLGRAARDVDPHLVVEVAQRAGGSVEDDAPEFLGRLDLRNKAARDVAIGAYTALRALRRSLGLEP